ncbi:hypothetical protein V8F20_001484 [Naviculisporaceae sp. PSN 640]
MDLNITGPTYPQDMGSPETEDFTSAGVEQNHELSGNEQTGGSGLLPTPSPSTTVPVREEREDLPKEESPTTNPEPVSPTSKTATPIQDQATTHTLSTSTSPDDEEGENLKVHSPIMIASTIVQENQRPCLWCIYYMVSFPFSERREFDEALGAGIVCARSKNEKNASHDGVMRCLRCRSGEPYRECISIPDDVSDSVLESVQEMVKEHKAYVKERYDEDSEKGQLRLARKLKLLVTPELHDFFTAIGAFSVLSKFELDDVEPLSDEEAAQILYEIDAQVNPQVVPAADVYTPKDDNTATQDGVTGDSSERPDNPSGQIAESEVNDTSKGQELSDPDATIVTTTPLPPEGHIQAALEVSSDPSLTPASLGNHDDLNASENGGDMAPESWTDMLGELYCDSGVVTTTNLGQEEDISAYEGPQVPVAGPLSQDEVLSPSPYSGHQYNEDESVDEPSSSVYSELQMSGALHPDDPIHESDQLVDDCVYSSIDMADGSPPSATLPSTNHTTNGHASRDITTGDHHSERPGDLLTEQIIGGEAHLSISFLEE